MPTRSFSALAGFVTIAVVAAAVAPFSARASGPEPSAPAERSAQDSPGSRGARRCHPQRPQAFLVRGNFVTRGSMSHEDRARRHAVHARAIRYRTEQYGYFEGFGSPSWNPHPPRYYARSVRFMGLAVTMHPKVHPALGCVERELARQCASHPYRPRTLAGIRFRNTYHTGEITNHAYGIAIDVDPDRNTCCHCVGPWAQHPLCHRPTRSIWERMAMPECWVEAFERYGFYWLGHDALEDTMHFEFLADPDAVLVP